MSGVDPDLELYEMAARTADCLIGMVIQDLEFDDFSDLEEEYGIRPPYKRFVARHLSYHAEALRQLGRMGIMEIDDRGGRCVLGEFVRPDEPHNLLGILPRWEETSIGQQYIEAHGALASEMEKVRDRWMQSMVGPEQALRGLLQMLDQVLTDTQFDIEHRCPNDPDCGIYQCTVTIRDALRPAGRALRKLEEGDLRLVLDLSTGHVPKDEAMMLNEGNCPWRMNVHGNGWMIYLQDEPPDPETMGWEDFPVLHKIVCYALQLRCGFINFDQDGSDHEELERFEW